MTSSIRILRSVQQVRQWRRQLLVNNIEVGFVPTMGALHEGHMSLVAQSLKENQRTVVSIFVNPSQFAPHEDLDAYPRTVDEDLAKLTAAFPSKGVDAVFLPKVSEMYPSGISLDVNKQRGAFVSVQGVSEQLEGVTRPQFFRGVATVVTKLLNIVNPTRVYFGQKDAQQCVVIKNLVKDLMIDTKVRVLPTLREPNGLAMSSRNSYLSRRAKDEASIIFRALSEGKKYYDSNNSGVVEGPKVVDQVAAVLGQTPAFEIEYIAVSHPETLEDLDEVVPGAILSTAVRVKRDNGETMRLIDNIILE